MISQCLLSVTLKHIDLHRGLSEIPQTKRRVFRRSHDELQRCVAANIGQFLVVACKEYR